MSALSLLLLALIPACLGGELIVHLFEWRFDDIAEECRSFLPQHGYTAIQTSPVNEHAVLPGRPWYERYQPFSYRINTRSGDESALRDMVKTCNDHGIKVFVDMVLNHMSATQPAGTVGTAGSVPDTANRMYPHVPFGAGDFHQICSINNWNDPWQIRNCELLELHDLNQGSDYVRGKMVEFLNRLVDIGVSGFRVDAAKHMNVNDLQAIYSQVKGLNEKWFSEGSRPFFYQEIPGNSDTDVIKPKEYFGIGSAMDFKFGFEMARAFRNQNQLKWYKSFGESWGLLPWNKSVVFIDNHDSQRDGVLGIPALTYKESKQYKMAVAFMLSWPHSVARVMSSYGFNDKAQGPPGGTGDISRVVRNADLSCGGGWICEHRWREIYAMAEFRRVVEGTQVNKWWDNGNYQISFCRGNKGFIAINADSSPLNADLQTCLPPGVYCDVASGQKQGNSCTGQSITVQQGGKARISIPNEAFDGFVATHINMRSTVVLHLSSVSCLFDKNLGSEDGVIDPESAQQLINYY